MHIVYFKMLLQPVLLHYTYIKWASEKNQKYKTALAART